MYKKFLRKWLFRLPPEFAHGITLRLLRWTHRLGLLALFYPKLPDTPSRLFGLSFKNPIGIAAGLDKNGDYLKPLAALGVGFIEVGAVTPKPQTGNPKPRLFRLPKSNALINRMGFNNKGVDHLVSNLRYRPRNCVIGVNLGKNKDTPLGRAADDYNTCLRKIFPYADFATINISSPNTPDLRKLQTPQYLQNLLRSVKATRDELQHAYHKKLPLLVKISPDLTDEELVELLAIVSELHLEGIIATNTTLDRAAVNDDSRAKESGGLSGAPLAARSLHVLQLIKQHQPQLPVISVGGIDSSTEAQRRFIAGADLIQVYTGLIYEGPGLLCELIKDSTKG